MREAALRGWTKVELSRQAGVSRSAIDKLSSQPRQPQAETVNKIADVLGIPRLDALALAGILSDGDVLAAAPDAGTAPGNARDDRPPVVRANWDDEQVQQLWELQHIPPAAKAGLIADYLKARGDGEAEAR